jgi:hypothetical protein
MFHIYLGIRALKPGNKSIIQILRPSIFISLWQMYQRVPLPRQLHNLNRYVVGILTGIAQKKIKAQSPFIFNKQPFASTCTPTLILSTDDELIPDPWNNGTLGAS